MKAKRFLLLLILPLIFLVGCTKNDLNSVSKNLNSYTMEITYTEDHTLCVKQSLSYTNNSEDVLDNLQLHLYPRSFRQGSKNTVVSTLNYNKCYYNGDSFGDINITKLQVDNTDSQIIYGGNDEDILDITLDEPLNPDKEIDVYIEYTVILPNINHRFGYGENTINLGNFYPIVCVYEDGEFDTNGYHYNGDPFYSEMSNYNVTINIPNKYTIASTGELVNSIETDTTNTYTYNALAVRDFAIVLSDKFNIVSGNIDNIQVNYYYYNNQYPNECLQASLDTISTFNKLFGTYPYTTLNVVEANFVHGGMEYPNLVYISDAVDVQSDYINVIVHEIAHQWWYGLVGNDEFSYGWLDEGLTEYSTLLFYENNPNYNVDTDELIKNTTNSYVTFVEVYNKVFDTVDTSMNRSLIEYKNESEYVYIAYVKGMLLFDNLREIIGEEKFMTGLKNYFENNKFGIATPEHLISAFEKSTGNNLTEFFSSWFNGKVTIMPIN